MKKLFSYLLWIIIFAAIVYYIYSSLLFVSPDHGAIIYSKFNGAFYIKKKPVNLVFVKGLPLNAEIKYFPLKTKVCQFEFKKQISLLDKSIDLLRYNILLEYNCDLSNYRSLYNNFNSHDDIDFQLEKKFNVLFHDRINTAIKSGENLNIFPKAAEKFMFDVLEKEYGLLGIKLIGIRIINIDIIPELNYNNLADMINRSLRYEEDFKIDLRKTELEKLRIRKEAENKVEHLKIIGDYIKENPLILKFMLIEKIDNNDIIFVPYGDIGFNFSDSLRSEAYKKFNKK